MLNAKFEAKRETIFKLFDCGTFPMVLAAIFYLAKKLLLCMSMFGSSDSPEMQCLRRVRVYPYSSGTIKTYLLTYLLTYSISGIN